MGPCMAYGDLMNRTALGIALILGVMVAYCPRLLAVVTVTEPTGGNNIVADKALNSTNGAGFTALGDIVITEGATSDFPVGNNKTLILTLPRNPLGDFGWRFNTAVAPSVAFITGRDITAASIAQTASNLTVTFSVAGTTKFDQ